MAIDANRLYTVDEAADLLQVTQRTIQRLLEAGKLPAKPFGRRIYIVGRELLALADYEPTSDDDDNDFALGELAARVTSGNLAAMAKMLNDAGADPRLDEIEPDANARADRPTVIYLFVRRADDSVGRALRKILSETTRR